MLTDARGIEVNMIPSVLSVSSPSSGGDGWKKNTKWQRWLPVMMKKSKKGFKKEFKIPRVESLRTYRNYPGSPGEEGSGRKGHLGTEKSLLKQGIGFYTWKSLYRPSGLCSLIHRWGKGGSRRGKVLCFTSLVLFPLNKSYWFFQLQLKPHFATGNIPEYL